jgi:frataxin-like iron-binding protein CyaY
MRKLLTQLLKAIPLLLVMLAVIQVNAQRQFTPLAPTGPDDVQYTLLNDVQTSDRTMEFDVYLQDMDATEAFEVATCQAGIVVNNGIYNGGTITIQIVAGSSGMVTAQQPTSIVWTASQNCIKITPKTPPGPGAGTILSTTAPGTRLIRLRITCTQPFTANSQANLAFNFTTVPYPTKIFRYIDGVNTQVATSASNCFSMLTNIILNPAATGPTAYPVT